MIPFLASWIGIGGPLSDTRRKCLLSARKHLCKTINESDFDPGYPTIQGVHCVIVDKQLFNTWWQEGGKTPTIRAPDYDATILIDDNAEICREAEDAGITCIHIHTDKRDQDIWLSKHQFHTFQWANSFAEAVTLITEQKSSKEVYEVVCEVWNRRVWDPPRVKYTVQQIELYNENLKRAPRSPGSH
jgi:hypothetical protein